MLPWRSLLQKCGQSRGGSIGTFTHRRGGGWAVWSGSRYRRGAAILYRSWPGRARRSVLLPLARLLLCLLACLGLATGLEARPRGPTVLAATSLQEALSEAADGWAAAGHSRPVLSFAASSALARQVESGAPADLFVSADSEWMDYLAGKRLLRSGTRAVIAGNRLVLVAPAGSRARLTVRRGFPLAAALGTGRLAMADPDAVPAGRYGKAALAWLGVWPEVSSRIARAENVRAALALVERKTVPFGIVYVTDARASRLVQVVGWFPVASHPPIHYEAAVLRRASHRDADAFRRFLLSRQGKAILAHHGFITGRAR